MVAISGRGWRLAPTLVRLVEETDRLFPNRSTASDGSIGDTAHSARVSDHNPAGGWVYAVDLTDDDAHGCDVGLLAHHLVASKDPRVKYLIHKGTAWRSYNKPRLPAWTPEPYTGANAHEHHLHVSILDDQRNSLLPWWPQSKPPPKPIPPPPAALQGANMLIRRASNRNERLLLLDAKTAVRGTGNAVQAVGDSPTYDVDEAAWKAIADHVDIIG